MKLLTASVCRHLDPDELTDAELNALPWEKLALYGPLTPQALRYRVNVKHMSRREALTAKTLNDQRRERQRLIEAAGLTYAQVKSHRYRHDVTWEEAIHRLSCKQDRLAS